MFPVVAYWFTVIGAALIVLDGGIVVVGAVLYSSALNSLLPGSIAITVVFGVVTVILGLVIVALGFRLRNDPMSARRTGIWIIVLALVSYIGAAGFLVGLVLVVVGGVLAMAWRGPTMEEMRAVQQRYGTLVGQPAEPVPPLPTGPRPGPRICPSCRSPNLGDAPVCAVCGSLLS